MKINIKNYQKYNFIIVKEKIVIYNVINIKRLLYIIKQQYITLYNVTKWRYNVIKCRYITIYNVIYTVRKM